MNFGRAGRYVKVLFIIGFSAVILSAIWKVPYIYSIIGFACWALVGHVVTVDDDLAGGWSNPDGDVKFPWFELAIKAFVLLGLMAIAILIPTVRRFGT